MATDFLSTTELTGDGVAAEQISRMARRYYWAGEYCRGRTVLEVACGAGQGLGYIATLAKSLVAGDYSSPLLTIAQHHYQNRVGLHLFDAQAIPFTSKSFDVILLFEALYYIPDVECFFRECSRLLRPGGVLLIATANKDLYDFNPSPHSHRYLGTIELHDELTRLGYDVNCFGDTATNLVSARQRLLRPLKAIAARSGFIPQTMAAKKFLKRIFFGSLVPMPAEITEDTAPRVLPVPISVTKPDRVHKVIFCSAKLRS